MKRLFCPLRMNFLGGWSDSPEWKSPSCVVNASIGWRHEADYSPYPLLRTAEGFSCVVAGVGTGLGISSIRAAADWLFDKADQFSPSNEYIFRALEWERVNGTKGGWQDQIGAIEPGLKCITTSDHEAFCIDPLPPADFMDRLILFDTGVRRPAKAIGDKVRGLFGDKKFQAVLKENVRDARHAHQYDFERFAKTSIEGFRRLCDFVPEMLSDVPTLPGAWGTMLMGAGGGGFGVAFLIDPSNAADTSSALAQAGTTAYRPVLLDGMKVE